MRISGSNAPARVGAPSALRRSASGGFSVAEEGAARGVAPSATLRTIGGIDALLALQGQDEPAERRRRAIKRGRVALDVLDELKVEVLSGALGPSILMRLKSATTELRDASGDPGLDTILAEIELRVAVEIAKMSRSAPPADLPGRNLSADSGCLHSLLVGCRRWLYKLARELGGSRRWGCVAMKKKNGIKGINGTKAASGVKRATGRKAARAARPASSRATNGARAGSVTRAAAGSKRIHVAKAANGTKVTNGVKAVNGIKGVKGTLGVPLQLDDQGYRPTEKEPFMGERQRDYFRSRLLLWREDILKEARETLQHLQDENQNHPDIADRASSETDRSIELRSRDRQRKVINKIDAALQRIDDGTYGYCEETGEPIALKRLEARPIATLSVEAQERHERRERIYRDD